ncbi:right-handed parallel beta-helix repeat-containing protein [Flavobacterium sp. AG291]|uniref:right-handed parallel beta-helix repeat-containing protein n=1 Tax=Flavobacterium sp. AG291 TaxID=2184000 RepID=UPI000E0B1285|nr:right-handed parallel beta-helix repeat-containing protein [Flavobacterium sp. AG291]RDI12179.1 parallel beta helix pectate lyase-like protein [Flavobacterium sp. AG291]
MNPKKLIFFLLICMSTLAFSQNRRRGDTLSITLKPSYDDFSAIQKALDNKGGKYLKIILDGKFVVGKTLVTRRNNTMLFFTKKSQLKSVSNINGILLIVHNNCIVKNGKFIGNNQSTDTFYNGFGVQLSDTENCKILNSEFSGISGLPIFLSYSRKGCKNNIVENNRIFKPAINLSQGGDEAGIMLGYSGDGYFHENNTISNNVIDGGDVLEIGAGIIGHGRNNTFSGNEISNCLSYGIVAYESAYTDVSLSGTIVKGNTIRNIGQVGEKTTVKGMGIYLMKSMDSKVSENKLYNTLRNSDKSETLGAGAIAISGAINAIVENNLIDGSGMYGFVNDYSFNFKFRNNTIKNTVKSGAYFINVSNGDIESNYFENIGAVVLRGYFENTGLDYIKKQWKISTYLNLETGQNLKIINNTFDSEKEILYFKGTSGKEQKIENKIKNNIFADNTIVRRSNTPLKDEDIAFRTESGNNIIKNNIIKKN